MSTRINAINATGKAVAPMNPALPRNRIEYITGGWVRRRCVARAMRSKEQPCQDAHYWDTLPEGVLVVAVADGAGSAALGEVGAAVAAQTAVEAICPQIRPPGARLWDDKDWKVLLTGCIKTARIAVETEAVELNNST